MKKLLFIVLFAFVATNMNAQFYTGLGLGYGFGSNKVALGTEISDQNAQTQLYGSFGEGINITGKFGYMFNDNLGVELGANYFMGTTQTLYSAPGALIEGTSNAFILLPQFVLKTKSGIYSRTGIAVPVAGKTLVTTAFDDIGDGNGTSMYKEEESHGTFTIGFVAAIGYSYSINEKISIFGELQYQGLSVISGTTETTVLKMNDKDVLSGMDVYDTEIDYVETLDATSNNASTNPTGYDKNSPKEELAGTSPFSSLGLNVGIIFAF